jgi:hypothetical protein
MPELIHTGLMILAHVQSLGIRFFPMGGGGGLHEVKSNRRSDLHFAESLGLPVYQSTSSLANVFTYIGLISVEFLIA